MAPTITLVMKDYDFLAPLACGDVRADGVNLVLDRETPMGRVLTDPAIHAGELSLSHYLIRAAGGDRSFLPVPFFAYRAFRHRCFYVGRASSLRTLADLEGRRVGTNSYPDTGNTWSRAALREAGVRLEGMAWIYGPVDDAEASPPAAPPRLPSNVRPAPRGRALRDLLLAGELDALMAPQPPRGFGGPDGEIVRLLPDYRGAEREYYRRTGVYPAHHIVGIRGEVVERVPEAARAVYDALERSKRLWQSKRREFSETTPWLLPDLEDTVALMGEDWSPNGPTAANRRMVAIFCEEQLAQGLVKEAPDPDRVFSEYAAVTGGA